MDETGPIRVLQIVGRMDRGGIENFVMNLYRNMDREKVQFDFLCHYGREAAFNDEIRALGGRIYEMPAIRDETHIYYWKVFQYIRALNRFFREHTEYRIIHGQMTNTAAIYMPIARKCGVTTRIAHGHSTRGKGGLQGFVTVLLQRPVRRFATHWFACSKAAALWLYPKEAVVQGKVRIVPNAVDARAFRFSRETRERVRRDLGLEDKLVIGCVARFRPEKNQSFLLKVLKKALEEEPRAVLLFVGDGPCEETARREAAALGLQDKTFFLGARADVPDLLQAMDVLAMPSLFEGMPVTGIEAQAAGLPLVVSTGVPEELDITGNVRLLPLDQGPKAWAEQIAATGEGSARRDTTELIRAKGYDIAAAAAWLQDFYLKQHDLGGPVLDTQ